MNKPYVLDIPGLDRAVEACQLSPKHKALVKVLQGFDGLHNARLAAHHDLGGYWGTYKVLDAGGALVADDHKAWLNSQLAMDGGQASQTHNRLKDAGYLLTKCEIQKLYFVHDRGGDQSNFVQLGIDIETEYVDRPLFEEHRSWMGPVRDASDLLSSAERGDAFHGDKRRLFRQPAYKLRKVTDISQFMVVAKAAHEHQRQRAREKMLHVTESTQAWDGTREGERTYTTSAASLDEGFDKFPWWRGERMLNDWAASSAGRSGARLCEHWVFETSDGVSSHDNQRYVNFVPWWTHSSKMAKVERAPNLHTLYGKLLSIDRRVGVPFAWFFYMLHGNLVRDGAGKAVIDGAEAGEIVLPEHDYQVLKRWRERPYGF